MEFPKVIQITSQKIRYFFCNGFERFLYRLNNAAKETVLIIKILL